MCRDPVHDRRSRHVFVSVSVSASVHVAIQDFVQRLFVQDIWHLDISDGCFGLAQVLQSSFQI